MIKINKGKEPVCLTSYKKQKFSSYDGLSKENKYEIIESLMKEQGYLCAYCMQRISHEKGATIEHITPQSTDASKALEYTNMLAVCDGNEGKGALICDKHRGNTKITVNPLDETTLKGIHYRSDGTIYSDDAVINKDLDKVLNLNCSEVGLPENRIRARKEFVCELQKIKPTGDINSLIRKFIEKYSGFNKKGQKYEYCGIILDWLKKHCK